MMTSFLILNRLKAAVLASLAGALFGFTAHAGLYTFDYSDSGAIPQGGTSFSAEHTISGLPSSITGVELILTFNNSASLTGSSLSGIQGTLILDPSGSDTYVSFSPVATRAGTGSQEIFDMSSSAFNDLSPNSTWALDLYDNSSTGIENGLVSWELEVAAVPEPVNVALGIFGALALGAAVFPRIWKNGKWLPGWR